jgi:membrane-associated phospholipid phosphatase
VSGPAHELGAPVAPLLREAAPASGGFAALVRSIYDRVDGWFEPGRGQPALDTAAKVVTGLGDRGLLWAVTTVWRARHPGPERARSVRALAVAGVESSLVNVAIKAFVGRDRPDRSDLRVAAGGVPVRRPKTSSFPSGHTLAAFCAATVMCQRGDRSGNALLFGGATLVGLSRLHLRAHHASDVAGGALIGVALGVVGRRFV